MKTITLQNKKESLIANANDVFTYIDSDFKKWHTNEVTEPKNGNTFEVHNLEKDSMFAQIFTDPENMWVSQGQIIEFCKNHEDELSKNRFTLFLFKVKSKFFVVHVLVNPDGLSVGVDEFSDTYVWYAEYGNRFVLPQLTFRNSESETLNHSDSLALESAIKICKEAGLVVTKIY